MDRVKILNNNKVLKIVSSDKVFRISARFMCTSFESCLGPDDQGRDSAFRICQALLKCPHLLHKIYFFSRLMHIAVCNY